MLSVLPREHRLRRERDATCSADAKISAMRTTFGPQACQLLAINSLPPDQVRESE